jgi:hypothetical protein
LAVRSASCGDSKERGEMRISSGGRVIALSLAIVFCARPFAVAQKAEQGQGETIACRVLETHVSEDPAVMAIVFHQQNKDDQTRVAEVLRAHSGDTVEIQMGGREWTGATMFRLKGCFGRGLLLLPAGAPAMKDGATFLLRVSPAAAKD